MDNKATETSTPAIAPKEEVKLAPEDDIEIQLKSKDVEIARLNEEKANYQAAYLKEKSKRGNSVDDEDERLRQIARDVMVDSRIGQVNQEKEVLLQKTLRENKELKLAQLNKSNTPPASIGSHTEAQSVRDNTISPDDLAKFKAMGKTDKWIENFKKNQQKNMGRVA